MVEPIVGLADATRDAHRYFQTNNHTGARAHLLRAMTQTYAPENLYLPAVDALKEACLGARDFRGAVACAWYQGDLQGARRMDRQLPPQDRARTLLLAAKNQQGAGSASSSELLTRASDLFSEANQIARAAICLEQAHQWERAHLRWSSLIGYIEQQERVDLYVSALAQFNLSRCARASGHDREAHDSAVLAVYQLEEAADRYEQDGRRERAFDCYQVLVSLGKNTGVIEHALEGYVNLIRILREDGLTAYALRSFAEAIQFLGSHEELAAASTVVRELVTYARAQGMESVANWALLEQARLSTSHANAIVSAGSSADLAENALLSAAQCYAEAEQYGRVGEVFVQLARLPIEKERRDGYARASGRYQAATNNRLPTVSPGDGTGAADSGAPVWHVDVVEWEQRGDAIEASADVLLEPEFWSEVTRRRVLLVRLAAIDVQALATEPSRQLQAKVGLAERLGVTELYGMLSPLEVLFHDRDVQVRTTVMKGLANFLYKRTIPSLRQGLRDSDVHVSSEARDAIAAMRFPHALEPLTRIYREEEKPADRQAALRALLMIDSDEVIAFLLSQLTHASHSEIALFRAALSNGASSSFTRAVRGQLGQFDKPVVMMLRQALNLR